MLRNTMTTRRRMLTAATHSALLALALIPATMAQMVSGAKVPGYAETFGLPAEPVDTAYSVQFITSSVPGNVAWPEDKPSFTFQLVNTTDQPLTAEGRVDLIAYGTKGRPNDIWVPDMVRIADLGSTPLAVDLPAKGFINLTVSPALPETFGAYALVADLGPAGRQFVTSFIRTFKANPKPIQFPQLCLDNSEIELLTRLGASPNRIGIGYKPTTDPDYEEWYRRTGEQLMGLKNAGLAITVEFGGGAFYHENQPLGRPRPWLDDQDAMMDTKFDLAWLPAWDEDFKKVCKRFAVDYGWPQGPINGFMLWNEPWNGISISGWGADDLRYREIYTKMCEAVEEARKEAGVEVLLGGCDSSSNTFDKLFGDGKTDFLDRLDFLSIHYQGMNPNATVKMFVERKGPRGRVRIWDTESWVANTDDRVAAVVACNLSTGHDRAVGIYHGNVATEWHSQNARILGPDGTPQNIRTYHTWSVAAAIGAVTHFVGERRFRELLFRPGLPWVMVFAGELGPDGTPTPDDGTVVVIGDIGEAFGSANVLFRNARGLKERAHEAELRRQLAALAADAAPEERQELLDAIAADEALSAATMALAADGDTYRLFDFYGNPVPAEDGKIVVPLDHRGFFLRPDGTPGSMAKLVAAIRESRIEGIEPLAKACPDLTAPIAAKPALRLRLTNVLNRAVAGTLSVQLGELTLDPAVQNVSFGPNETREIAIPITGGDAVDSNSYPLSLTFDAGADGVSSHQEDVHVNLIAHRTIAVDGSLDDWQGVLPQTVRGDTTGSRTLQQAAWLPFMPFDENVTAGLATGFVAYDADFFYFAAKIADDTPHPGTVRFETRDEDAYFYPPVSYRKVTIGGDQVGQNFSVRWSGFVVPRFSERYTFTTVSDDGVRLWVDGRELVNNWTMHGATEDSGQIQFEAGRAYPLRLEYMQGGGGACIQLRWQSASQARETVPAECLRPAAEEGTGLHGEYFIGTNLGTKCGERTDDAIDFPRFPDEVLRPFFGTPQEVLETYEWPAGTRRYSYRMNPVLPAGNFPRFDNVQIAFNVLEPDDKWMYTCPPGTLPGYAGYVCTDYEYALNPVAEAHGGGTEIWRLQAPGMPHKHFYPHSVKSPMDGPVAGGTLVVRRDDTTRYVECAIPWAEIPHVRARLDAGETIKFSYRVNDDANPACMELSRNRSVAKRNGSFTVDWVEHWANELEFAFER